MGGIISGWGESQITQLEIGLCRVSDEEKGKTKILFGGDVDTEMLITYLLR